MRSEEEARSVSGSFHRSWLWLGIGLLLMVAFTGMASEVMESETARLDAVCLQLAQQWRASSPKVEIVMRDLSGVGSGVVLTLATLATAGYLWVSGHAARAVLVVVSMGTGELAVSALKHSFGRARPDPALAAFVQDGLSFPSAHAGMSAIFFLTVGALLAQAQSCRPARAYVIGIAVLCTGLVGFSRVALGVHWASDVIAGWTFGAGWAALWLYATRRLRGAR